MVISGGMMDRRKGTDWDPLLCGFVDIQVDLRAGCPAGAW